MALLQFLWKRIRFENGRVTATTEEKKVTFEGRAWVNFKTGVFKKMAVKTAYYNAPEIVNFSD
jgi:hypothetical protein